MRESDNTHYWQNEPPYRVQSWERVITPTTVLEKLVTLPTHPLLAKRATLLAPTQVEEGEVGEGGEDHGQAGGPRPRVGREPIQHQRLEQGE